MTDLEDWKQRFRTGAAAAYDWQVRWQLIDNGPRRCLRAILPAPLPAPAEPCPLVMQELLDGEPSELGKDMLQIIFAADDDPQADPALQQELWDICDVNEITHADGTPCSCQPGTVGWARHHGMAPSEAGLSQAFYEALGIDEEHI